MTQPSPIGYLVPEFPNQTHAFFWREVSAIEEMGVPVRIFSTRRPDPRACPHDFASSARARTTYLFPPALSRVSGFLATRPAATARAMAYIAGLSEIPLPRRAVLMGLIGAAAELVIACRAAGIGHVHIHSCANAAHLGALGHILGDLKYSLTLHGDLPVYGTDHRAKMARAEFVSAVTAPLQASLRAQIDPMGRFPVIWMGVDTSRFQPDPTRQPRMQTDPFDVFSAARLNSNKGHRYFLQAMAQLVAEGHNIRYRLAGEGPERDAIEAEITRLNLSDRVTLLGSVGEDRILELLQSSDALALTSVGQGEAAPVAVMEAMACGLPPICSIIGGTTDMITDGVDGFLVPQADVQAITEATRQLAKDPQCHAEMGAAARKSALASFDHRANAQKLYREIAGG